MSPTLPLIRVFQRFDVDLLHLEHCVHHAFGFFRILVVQHVDQNRRNDLPRHAEFVLEPAARGFFAAIGGEFLPKIIHFVLRFAVHDERDRFVEFEKWTAIKGNELLAFHLEFNG